MSYSAPLPNTGVILPVPGSGQAWEVAVFNSNFTGVDSAIGADRVRLGALESKLVGNPLIPAGSSAARDGYYGSPGSAAARIGLANTAPRWFNTDKGYEERYFAATGDSATAGYNTLYARPTAGWKPVGAGLVPVNVPAPAATGGTVTVNGNVITIGAGVTLFSIDNLFTDDFIAYKMLSDIQMASSGYLSMQTRTAGVTNNAANSYSRETMTAIAASVLGASATDSQFLLSYTPSTGFFGEATVWNPAQASRATVIDSVSQNSGGHGRITQQRAAGADDGIRVANTSGGAITGTIQVFGYNGGHI